MTDLEFLQAFEACELPPECFHHREHIRLAWICLGRHPQQEAERRIANAIRRYAAHLGASQKYHETITLAWVRLVAAAMSQAEHPGRFEAVLQAFPSLLDKRTLESYYSVPLLASDAARTGWVEPDLRPLTPLAAGVAR